MKKMKQFIGIMLLAALALSCSDSKQISIDGRSVDVGEYGWANLDDENSVVKYRVCVGNVVWSAIFIETIVVPVILTGWYLFEPVGPKYDNKVNQ